MIEVKFFVDKNVAYLARMLRELGYDAESVIDVKRRNGPDRWMWRDTSIRRYAQRNGRILITADWGLYHWCRRIGHPAYLVADNKGVLSKREILMAVVARFDPPTFHLWTATGMPTMARWLKYNGDWDVIRLPRPEDKVKEITDFDPLGYPLPHFDPFVRPL